MSNCVVYAAAAHQADRATTAIAEWRRGARAPVDTVDADDTSALAAICSGGLFGGPRWCEITRIERLQLGNWWTPDDELHAVGMFTWQRAADRRRIEHLADQFDIVWCDDRWVGRFLGEIFARRGVTLTSEARQLLTTRCSDNLVRACAVAQAANMADITTLSVDACRTLLGSQWPSGVLFDVIDDLFDGNYQRAVSMSRGLDPVHVAHQLCDQFAVAIVGAHTTQPQQVARTCGIHPFVAKKRVAAARRHGSERLQAALDVSTAALLRARRGGITSAEIVARCAGALNGAACDTVYLRY